MKKIIFWFLLFLFVWLNQTFADSILASWLNGNSVWKVQTIWTTASGFLDNQYLYTGDGWYFITGGSANCFYNHLWNVIVPAPFSCTAFAYVNSYAWHYETIETERFNYFITKPYNQSASTTTTSYKQTFVTIFDKKENLWYQHTYTYTSSHSQWILRFWLNWKLYFKHYYDSTGWKYFETSDELGLWFVDTTPPANIQYNVVNWYSTYYIRKYLATDDTSTLYFVNANDLYYYSFVNDPDLWIVKNSWSMAFPSNPLWINITTTSYQDYTCLNHSWNILCSFYAGSHTTPTASNFALYAYEYNSSTQSWSFYDDTYFFHYNNEVGAGWYTNKVGVIEDNLKFSWNWPLKVGYFSQSLQTYRKTYYTNANTLNTNDIVNEWNFSYSWSIIEVPPAEVGGWSFTIDLWPITDIIWDNGENIYTNTGSMEWLYGTGVVSFGFIAGSVAINTSWLDEDCKPIFDESGNFNYTKNGTPSSFIHDLNAGTAFWLGSRWEVKLFGVNLIGWAWDTLNWLVTKLQAIAGAILNTWFGVFDDYFSALRVPERNKNYCFLGTNMYLTDNIKTYYSYHQKETIVIEWKNNIEYLFLIVIAFFVLIYIYKKL